MIYPSEMCTISKLFRLELNDKKKRESTVNNRLRLRRLRDTIISVFTKHFLLVKHATLWLYDLA